VQGPELNIAGLHGKKMQARAALVASYCCGMIEPFVYYYNYTLLERAYWTVAYLAEFVFAPFEIESVEELQQAAW
jgi:hypothetical protein